MRDLRGSKVLVTGAGGFLARHLVPKLAAQGAEVVGMDLAPGVENARRFKSKARLVEGDITDYASIERAADKCDYVVHLAAIAAPLECEKRPERAFLVNVQGTYNVLKFAQRKGVRKVISSCYDAQTMVMTKSGLKRYESVQAGDEVRSVDPTTR